MKKKQIVLTTSLIAQMLRVDTAFAQNEKSHSDKNLQELLNQHLLHEAQAVKPGSVVRTFGDNGSVWIKKLRTPFQNLQNSWQASSTGASTQNSSTGTAITSSTGVAPLPPPTGTDPGPPSVGTGTQPAPTSSTTSPTSSTAVASPSPTSPVKKYNYQIGLGVVGGEAAKTGAPPYYFANKLREDKFILVFVISQFAEISDLAKPQARSYMVINKKTGKITFAPWKQDIK